ncbi:hypothetical protein LPJ59_003598, partial [Coemansia sp. RSA 2399]
MAWSRSGVSSAISAHGPAAGITPSFHWSAAARACSAAESVSEHSDVGSTAWVWGRRGAVGDGLGRGRTSSSTTDHSPFLSSQSRGGSA